MSKNIKALCPDISRYVQVLDNWYPSYRKNNKLYVCAEVVATDAIACEYKSFCDAKGNKYRYCVVSSYSGADDVTYSKVYLTNDMTDAVKHYRCFKKLLKRLQRSYPQELKLLLSSIGFE